MIDHSMYAEVMILEAHLYIGPIHAHWQGRLVHRGGGEQIEQTIMLAV